MRMFAALTPFAVAIPTAFAAPGELDASFGSGGIATVQVSGGPGGGITKVLEETDSELLVTTDFSQMFLLKSNGTLDTTFGTNGITTFSEDGFTVNLKFNTSFGVARVLSNGTLDTSFGTGGVLTTSFPNNVGAATYVTTQANGDILVGGVSENSSGTEVATVVRYLSE
jgi:hypothetical protein